MIVANHPELINKQIIIRNSDDLFNFINTYARNGSGQVEITHDYIPFMKGQQEILLKLVVFKDLGDGQLEMLPASDNNMFD